MQSSYWQFISIVLLVLFVSITKCSICTKNTKPFYNSTDVNAGIVNPIARDCKEWYAAGVRVSGVYPVQPDDDKGFQVYCDMETDGGGFTVLMRRQDGSVNFDRNWADYEAGFGNLEGEFFLGLSNMHRLTPSGQNTLRFDLGDFETNYTAVALYSEFEILDVTADYAIVVKNYSGTAGDGLYKEHNLMRFTTKDKDNDLNSRSNCAKKYPDGGWWFNNCLTSRLTGTYFQGGKPDRTFGGVNWTPFKGKKYSLRFVEMKTRRKE